MYIFPDEIRKAYESQPIAMVCDQLIDAGQKPRAVELPEEREQLIREWFEPEQPGNTGAIGRTCICAGATPHLIRPFGFRTDEKSLRRAGLDYWPRLGVRDYLNYNDFLQQHADARIWYLTTKGCRRIDEATYRDGDFLMFGKESAGIPGEILRSAPDRCIRIPMVEGERSLNLSNAVAIALYEALRQVGYAGME